MATYEDARALIRPVTQSYLSLDTEERVEMFEESVVAGLQTTAYMVKTLSPSEIKDLINTACDRDYDDAKLADEWAQFWKSKSIFFMEHPMFLSMFLLLIHDVLQVKTDVETLAKKVGINLDDRTYNNMLMNMKFSSMN